MPKDWRSADNMGRLIDMSPDSTFVSRIDNFQFVEVNDRACKDYGYSREEFLQMQIFDIEVDSQVESAVREVYKNSPIGTVVEIEGRNKRKDGTTFPIHVRFCKLDDEYAVANVRDVTHLKEIDDDLERRVNIRTRELEQSEQRVRQLLDSTAEAIYGLDMDGFCTFCNPACIEMLGWKSEADLLGKNMDELIHYRHVDGSDNPVDQSKIHASFRHNKEVHAEDEVLWRADGSSFPVEYRSHPVLRDGQVIGAVVTFLDISEKIRSAKDLREREEQLQQSLKMEAVGNLADAVAHEFNNILTMINGYSSLLLADLGKDDPLRQGLTEIMKAGNRAATLTRRLLTFSRNQVPILTVINVEEMLNGMKETLQHLIGEKFKLDIQCVSQLRIEADRRQIERAIVNLLLNARDSMPAGGRIVIEADTCVDAGRLAGDCISLTISDAGSGMNKKTLARIFEPFFTTKAGNQNIGLGLSIVKSIIKQSGGTIEVESKVNVGSTFSIYLPVAAEPQVNSGPNTVNAQETEGSHTWST